MPFDLFIILIVVGIILAIAGAAMVFVKENPYGSLLVVFGFIVFISGIGIASSSGNSFLSEFGDEPRDAIVVSLGNKELCMVFDGERDVRCIEKEFTPNLIDPYLGYESAGPPFIGVRYEVIKVKIHGREVILLANKSVPFPCQEEEGK
jgi:hypothetical protein